MRAIRWEEITGDLVDCWNATSIFGGRDQFGTSRKGAVQHVVYDISSIFKFDSINTFLQNNLIWT